MFIVFSPYINRDTGSGGNRGMRTIGIIRKIGGREDSSIFSLYFTD